MAASLTSQLQALVDIFGKRSVEKALAKIQPPKVKSGTKVARRRNASTKGRAILSNGSVRDACRKRPDAASLLERLAMMYNDRTFLGQFRDVIWFARDHGRELRADTRSGALGEVMELLAQMSVSDLKDTVDQAVHRHEVGDFMLLANAIMGIPDKKAK